jgi:colanic acid/amylovoran biosynthesis protein
MTETGYTSIGILGANFDTPNLGVGALASGAIRCLRATHPDNHLFFLDFAREPSISRIVESNEPINIPLVNMRFSKRFWLPNNIVVLLLLALVLKAIPFLKMRRWLVAHNRCLNEICCAGSFAAVSGGDSFSDLYGFPRFLYVALPQILILLLGKPLVLLPQTYGPFRGSLAKRVAQGIVARAERAFCRDRSSLDELTGSKGADTSHERQSFCYDMAFGIDSVKPQSIDVAGFSLRPQRSMHLVGLNVSGLLYREDPSHASAYGIHSNYRTLVHAILDMLLASEETSVLLVPHVYGSEAGSESDLLACEEVFTALHHRHPGRLGTLRGTYSPSEIRYVIGFCGFFVGSRMHACIAALSQNIPAVTIAYSDKFLGVLDTIGIPTLVADARKLDHSAVLSVVSSAFENRHRIAQELEAAMPAVRATVHHLLDVPSLHPALNTALLPRIEVPLGARER